MAEALIDGIGNAYKAEVTSDNELKVTNKKAILGEKPNGGGETETGAIKINEDNKLDISQSDLFNVFNGILKELRKMNLQLAIMNDMVVKDTDIPI